MKQNTLAGDVTFLRLAQERLDRLWRALHDEPCPEHARARLDALVSPWSTTPVPAAPTWPSDIGDDHSPFEFSVAIGGKAPELRLLVEAQGSEPSHPSMCRAARALTESLVAHGADLSRFRCVEDLLLPDVPAARFGLWHAAKLAAGGEIKAYFNPQILGTERAFDLVEQAMSRLGFGDAWPTLLRAVQRRTHQDEIRYFALDLSTGARARVKVYFYQRGVTTDHLERMASIRPGYQPGEVSAFCEAMTGTRGPYFEHPLCTYLSFVEGDLVPNDFVVQIPIRHYTRDDADAQRRIIAYMRSRDLPTAIYERAVEAVRGRPLDTGRGLHTYVSLRTGTPRLTFYLATEAFGTMPPLRASIPVHAPQQASPLA